MGSAIKSNFGKQAAAGGTPADVKFNIALGRGQPMARSTTTGPIMVAMGVNPKEFLGLTKTTLGLHVPETQRQAAASQNKISSRTVGQPSGMSG